MRFTIALALLLLIASCCRASDHDAAAALALALASRSAPVETPVVPATPVAPKEPCPCSSACVCGCQQGKECPCIEANRKLNARPVVVPQTLPQQSYSVPMAAPVGGACRS